MITKEDRVKLFINELNDISDPNIRELAKILIENADEYFFVVPASSSGKYHPDFARGEGGLVRHTRCVAYFAGCMAESMMFSQHDKDLLILAALAHDIKKQGDGSGKHTVTEHPLLASEYLSRIASENKGLLLSSDLIKVCSAVERHMGKWEAKNGLPVPETEFEKALQAADYVASRKEILGFNFRPTVFDSQSKPVDDDPGDFVLDFGKNKGLTIREVHELELNLINSGKVNKKDTYIEWMASAEGFQRVEAQNKAKAFLAIYKKTPPPMAKKQMTDKEMQSAIDNLPF